VTGNISISGLDGNVPLSNTMLVVPALIAAFEFKWGTKPAKAPQAFTQAYPNTSFEVINPENYLAFIT
jgi:hypothetical protein